MRALFSGRLHAFALLAVLLISVTGSRLARARFVWWEAARIRASRRFAYKRLGLKVVFALLAGLVSAPRAQGWLVHVLFGGMLQVFALLAVLLIRASGAKLPRARFVG